LFRSRPTHLKIRTDHRPSSWSSASTSSLEGADPELLAFETGLNPESERCYDPSRNHGLTNGEYEIHGLVLSEDFVKLVPSCIINFRSCAKLVGQT